MSENAIDSEITSKPAPDTAKQGARKDAKKTKRAKKAHAPRSRLASRKPTGPSDYWPERQDSR